MKSSFMNVRVVVLIALIAFSVTFAGASPNSAASLPGHGNVATPLWPVPTPPTGNVAVNTPLWPVPTPPTGNVA